MNKSNGSKTEVNMSNPSGANFNLACPIPISDYPNVLLAHGSGGKLMHNLLEKLLLPAFSNPLLETRHDGAVFPLGNTRLAFTTDSYVVQPLFFPGGNIGTLAVNGTVNDLAMCGAKPLFLSAGFILEEGLPMETLWQVIQSMQQAAQAANVQIVTGDTKVVDKGKGDGIFINTAGVGIVEHQLTIAPSSVRPGDAILLNGDIGRHGMAIMAAREGLAFESEIESDCAPLAATVLAMLDAGIEIHCLRDLTRGGLASGLVEIATDARLHLHIDETTIPIIENVRGACEILGLDPMYVANEGRFIAFVPADQAERARLIMGENTHLIGTVQDDSSSLVTMRSTIGANRIVDMLSGEQLPRIC
ncbi:MAG TPA: hydrogenase expression/formation protein HypE [Phototrophicaceae bacterium]|jgi:hydrogenase expression/formation protein HypE|nr:hydrogenase expression/formation protein HypE [Phototrophicaceae bacterium]